MKNLKLCQTKIIPPYIGTVQNQKDGTVHVVAEGDESMLETYLGFLKKGSLFSRVEKVDCVWKDASGEFSGFKIVYRDLLDRI